MRFLFPGLRNVYFFQCNLDYFRGAFDVGVSLHACGVATDLVLRACLANNACFVSCPCCYGSLQENHVLAYPKSRLFRDFGWDFKVRICGGTWDFLGITARSLYVLLDDRVSST